MSQYSSGGTLEFLVARCLSAKPNSSQSEAINSINSRIRTVINSRIYWSDLLAVRVISFPNQVNTGTVALTLGSASVVGTGTSAVWPTNDVVDTTTTTAVQDTGYLQITPTIMTGIAVDTLLYYDPNGANPEVVPVVEVTPTSFWGKFQYAHSSSCAIWSSSLAGLQLNIGENSPIFDVWAVPSSTSLILNQPWGAASVSSVSYQIYRQYVTIDPLLKVILSVVDTVQGIPIQTYTQIEKLDAIDPQRSSQMNPLCLAQFTPTPAGTMRYEAYPAVTSPYQLRAIVGLQWPDLKYDTDRAPWFIDPNLFVTGACADLLRIKNCRIDSDKDPWFNPQLAMQYEQLFRLQLQDAVNADQAKAQRNFTNLISPYDLPGGNWNLAHDQELVRGLL